MKKYIDFTEKEIKHIICAAGVEGKSMKKQRAAIRAAREEVRERQRKQAEARYNANKLRAELAKDLEELAQKTPKIKPYRRGRD